MTIQVTSSAIVTFDIQLLTPWHTRGIVLSVYSEPPMSKNNQLITKDFFSLFDFWDGLTRDEQHVVKTETVALGQKMAGVAMLRVEMGESLLKVHAILDGKRLFLKYLSELHFSRRTAYRLMGAYKAASAGLSPFVLKAAAARGRDLVGYSAKNPYGAYSEALKRLPPPSDEREVPEWLDKLEEEKRRHPARRSKKPREPDAPLKTAYQKCAVQFKAVPPGKTRTQLALRLIGMLMWEFGLPAQTVRPEAPPEEFKPRGPGRPKIKKDKK